jgi:hypothetical protein
MKKNGQMCPCGGVIPPHDGLLPVSYGTLAGMASVAHTSALAVSTVAHVAVQLFRLRQRVKGSRETERNGHFQEVPRRS